MSKKTNDPSQPKPSLRERAEVAVRATSTDIARMSAEQTQRMVYELQVHQIELEMQNEELRRGQEELAHSRDRYVHLYDFSPVGYLTLDPDGAVLEANLSMAAMLGVERGQLVGRKFSHFVTPDAQDTLYLHQRAVPGLDETLACELRLHRADGTIFTAQMASIGLRDAVSGTRDYLSVISDITEQKQAEEQVRQLNRHLEQRVAERVAELASKTELLTQQNAEMEQAYLTLEEKAAELALISKYKSEFLANMSHELRTPLNGMLILSGLLARNHQGNLDAQQVKSATIIHEGGQSLLLLITDILDMAQIEAGRMAVQSSSVALDQVAGANEREFRPLAEKQGLSFTVTRAPGLPQTLHTDAQRLQQILRNLLANAFKFSHQGGVTLTLRPELAADSPLGCESIAFDVADTGIGIAPDKQQLIFEAFQQADTGNTRRYGGTGLGLSISKELARLLGGAIRLRSEEAVGSCFTLHLPLQVAAGPAPRPPQRADLPLPPQGRDGGAARQAALAPSVPLAPLSGQVLVVDDDARNRYAFRAMLDVDGLLVIEADSGEQALQKLAENPTIAIILVDIEMPGMGGHELLRVLRRDPRWRSLPAIAVTAQAFPADRDKCLAAGANDYIAKPVNVTQMVAMLRRWIGQAV